MMRDFKFALGAIVRHVADPDSPRMLIVEQQLCWRLGAPNVKERWYLARIVTETDISDRGVREEEIIQAPEDNRK